jgi:hypothetical protein
MTAKHNDCKEQWHAMTEKKNDRKEQWLQRKMTARKQWLQENNDWLQENNDCKKAMTANSSVGRTTPTNYCVFIL